MIVEKLNQEVTEGKEVAVSRKVKLKKGFSLIEMIAVLGITGVLGIVILGTAMSVSASQKVSSESQTLSAAVTTVQSIYASSGYASVSSSGLAGMASFPNPMKNNAKDGLRNTWGGGVDISGDPSGDTFSVTYTGIPDDTCEEFRIKNEGQFSATTACTVDSAIDETSTVTFTSF